MFSFRLTDDFVDSYRDKTPPFGYTDAGGNSIGQITFIRTYSRLKADGSGKETWVDVCRRVIEGMFSIQKDHCKASRLPWNNAKAQSSAQDAFDRLFHLKWTPPGRGLWVMGTPLVMEQRNSAALQNCSFISTKEMTKQSPSKPFAFLQEASMLGVGVGFDTEGAKKDFTIYAPTNEQREYVIPDTREGWVESTSALIDSYLKPNSPTLVFDYSQIRPAGAPIATFGGTAAGPEPLIRLHDAINKLFADREGTTLTSVDIADIGNLIGVCTVSGNVRRSAELLMGSIDDPDFLNLKNAEAFPERNSYDPASPGWAYMSNNSVSVTVGTDLSKIIDGIALNGEPGVIWMDTTRKYGRLADPINNKDHRALGYNPSLVPGTLVYTTDGIFPIEELEGKNFSVRNLDGQISEAFCWKSGENKPIHWVNLSGGWSYGATKEHKWPVWDQTTNQWVKKATTELRSGDLLPNVQQKDLFSSGTLGTYEEGFLIGWNLGDGWQTVRKDGRTQYGFIVSDHDRASGIADSLVASLTACGVSTDGFADRNELNVSAAGLHALFQRFGVKHKKDGLPSAVWDANVSDDFRRGLIDALFSSDGTITTSDRRLCISQSSEKMIDDIASLLGFFGVKTSKQVISRPRSEAFPTKYEDDGSTFTRYTLRIGQYDNLHHFSQVFSLSHQTKQDRLAEVLQARTTGSDRGKSDPSKFITVESITQEGTSDVWDVTVYDETHAFQLDHCVTGNCAEQSLESQEMCTLVETYLNNHESLEDYKKTLKVAYLYGKTVTLLPTHWEETNAIMQRNRRIGLSMSGIANFADTTGLPALRDWMDEGYNTVQYYDNVYSEWLCVRPSIKTTTVKPSGTVSILAGESPGVHWTPGGKYFLRAIRFANDDAMLPLFRMANYTVEPASENPDHTSVVYFPIKSNAQRAERDVSIFEKMALAATAQRYWSDNSVSVTISFDPDTESKHVGTVLHMYDGQLKTVSFLPSGNFTYPQMPYSQITEEEYEAYTFKLLPVPLEPVYEGMTADAIGEQFCSSDSCVMRVEEASIKKSE